jgi:hypothetical protein
MVLVTIDQGEQCRSTRVKRFSHLLLRIGNVPVTLILGRDVRDTANSANTYRVHLDVIIADPLNTRIRAEFIIEPGEKIFGSQTEMQVIPIVDDKNSLLLHSTGCGSFKFHYHLISIIRIVAAM